MELNDLCQSLEWDSQFFGRKIARLIVHHLRQENIEAIELWCNSHSIDCLYFLADANDVYTVRLAEDNGFRLVDIRVTLEKKLGNIVDIRDKVPKGEIRKCTPEDIPALRAIARTSHRDTRFYYDKNFPESLCNSLYETWIDKSCQGYADIVLVGEIESKVVGYISCHIFKQKKGQIGLVGISPDWQNQGLGQRLIHESLNWFGNLGVSKVQIVTQGRNCQAQRLYQRCGFLTHAVQLWYHRWFAPE